jgi:hypothetical protein
MNKLFVSIYTFHILLWVFVLSAFLNKKTAFFNVYYLIPFIYIVHLLPFHVLTKTENNIGKEKSNEMRNSIKQKMIIPYLFFKLKHFFDFSFQNPFSNQGMMIFGLITSAYKLRY